MSGDEEHREAGRVSDLHVADLPSPAIDSRQQPPKTPAYPLRSSRLSFLASGYGGFPSGPCPVITVTAGMRCGLVQSAARSDRGSTALEAHILIAPSFGPQ